MESVADLLFPSPDSRFDFGTLIISRGLLPGHAALLSNTSQVAIALGRCGFMSRIIMSQQSQKNQFRDLISLARKRESGSPGTTPESIYSPL
jgi:hypothetical protein